MSTRSEFDFHALDYQALTPAQRSFVVREVVRQAHEARAAEIRGLSQALWHGTARIAALGMAGGRRAGAAALDALIAAWRRYQRGRRRRITATQLYAMDDRTLKDIGLHRGEIDFVVSGATDSSRRPRGLGQVRNTIAAGSSPAPNKLAA